MVLLFIGLSLGVEFGFNLFIAFVLLFAFWVDCLVELLGRLVLCVLFAWVWVIWVLRFSWIIVCFVNACFVAYRLGVLGGLVCGWVWVGFCLVFCVMLDCCLLGCLLWVLLFNDYFAVAY